MESAIDIKGRLWNGSINVRIVLWSETTGNSPEPMETKRDGGDGLLRTIDNAKKTIGSERSSEEASEDLDEDCVQQREVPSSDYNGYNDSRRGHIADHQIFGSGKGGLNPNDRENNIAPNAPTNAATGEGINDTCGSKGLRQNSEGGAHQKANSEGPPRGAQEYLMTIPRNSYFPVYFGAIARYFGIDTPIWLEHNSVALKWNLPAGVLYDHLNVGGAAVWQLVLRTKDYPAQSIIPFVHGEREVDYEKTLEQVLANVLKQSCYVLNGTSKPMMNLGADDSRTLLAAIKYHNLYDYEHINRKLVHKFQRVPIKLYIAGSADVVQAPVAPVEQAREMTLREVLQKFLPSSAASTPWIHGIDARVLLDSCILDVYKQFRHLDNVLHVVVKPVS